MEDILASNIPDDTPIVDGTIFARLTIAVMSTPGGKTFALEFFAKELDEIKVFAAKLPALHHKQDAFTVLSRSIINKLSHLRLVWSLFIPLVEGARL